MTSEELRGLSERELLVLNHTDICWVKKLLNNHLRHHWIITVAALTAAFGFASAFLIVLIKYFMPN